jgi:signal transduction histidine kinase
MSAPLALTGWLLAVGGFLAAALVARRLAERMDAVAKACHELRGPLTVARLGLEIGLRDLPDPQRHAVELELGQATLALDDLLRAGRDGRRGRGGPAGPRVGDELVGLADLLTDCVEAWQAAACPGQLELRLSVRPERALVRGERLRLAQATGNLIGNALEHGAGTVEVSLRRAGEQLRIEIADQGPGLPAPVDALVRRDQSGRGRQRIVPREHGHGLAIAAVVAAAHRGRLRTAPTQRGARMVLELPAADEPDAGRAGRAGAPPGRTVGNDPR